MKIITGKTLQEYFLSRVVPIGTKNFYRVVKPIFVFKKVYTKNYTRAIANLIILPESVVYNPNPPGFGQTSDRKLRANKTYVHSIVSKKKQEQCKTSFSYFDSSFKYIPNTFVTPKLPFSYYDNCCESGIHFFLNLQDALDY